MIVPGAEEVTVDGVIRMAGVAGSPAARVRRTAARTSIRVSRQGVASWRGIRNGSAGCYAFTGV